MSYNPKTGDFNTSIPNILMSNIFFWYQLKLGELTVKFCITDDIMEDFLANSMWVKEFIKFRKITMGHNES